MPFSIAGGPGKLVLKLEGTVTIRQATDLAARLAEIVDDGVPIAIDTEDLVDVDTCILQLLCSLHRTMPALSFDDSSDAFLAMVDRCGLRRELFRAAGKNVWEGQ